MKKNCDTSYVIAGQPFKNWRKIPCRDKLATVGGNVTGIPQPTRKSDQTCYDYAVKKIRECLQSVPQQQPSRPSKRKAPMTSPTMASPTMVSPTMASMALPLAKPMVLDMKEEKINLDDIAAREKILNQLELLPKAVLIEFLSSYPIDVIASLGATSQKFRQFLAENLRQIAIAFARRKNTYPPPLEQDREHVIDNSICDIVFSEGRTCPFPFPQNHLKLFGHDMSICSEYCQDEKGPIVYLPHLLKKYFKLGKHLRQWGLAHPNEDISQLFLSVDKPERHHPHWQYPSTGKNLQNFIIYVKYNEKYRPHPVVFHQEFNQSLSPEEEEKRIQNILKETTTNLSYLYRVSLFIKILPFPGLQLGDFQTHLENDWNLEDPIDKSIVEVTVATSRESGQVPLFLHIGTSELLYYDEVEQFYQRFQV